MSKEGRSSRRKKSRECFFFVSLWPVHTGVCCGAMRCVCAHCARGSMATARGLIVWQVPTVVAVMSTEHGDLTPHGYSKENEGGRNQTCMLRAGRRPGGAGVARRKGAGAAVTRMSRERRKARYPGRQEDGKGWRNQNAYQNGQMQAPVTLQ